MVVPPPPTSLSVVVCGALDWVLALCPSLPGRERPGYVWWARGCTGVLRVASLPARVRPEGSGQMGIPLGAGCGSEF